MYLGDDFHHNGAFRLSYGMEYSYEVEFDKTTDSDFPFPQFDLYDWYLKLGSLKKVNDMYFHNKVPTWNNFVKHPNYDEYWQARNLRPHLKDIKPAVMTVGGWFDAEDLFGALHVYQAIQESTPGAQNMLVMGPWFHGGWSRSDGDFLGNVRFGSKTSVFYRENIEFPFFSYWLKGKKNPNLPKAFVFETGANQWRQFDAWPPKSVTKKSLYFHSGGKLSFDASQRDRGRRHDGVRVRTGNLFQGSRMGRPSLRERVGGRRQPGLPAA